MKAWALPTLLAGNVVAFERLPLVSGIPGCHAGNGSDVTNQGEHWGAV